MRSFINWIHSLTYVVKGARAVRRGDDEGVIRNYSKAIEISPEDLDYYYARGHAYWHQHELGHAIADFTQVIELKPDDIHAHLARGAVYRERGNLQQAMRDLNLVVDASGSTVAHYLRAVCYSENEEYELALADLQPVLEFDPADARALKLQDHVRGQIHLRDFRDEKEKASRTGAADLP